MPYEIDWVVKDSVIIERISGKISLDEAFATAEIILEMIHRSDRALVHVLVDLTEMTEIPNNVRDIVRNVKPVLQHERIGWTIAFGKTDKFTNYLMSIVTGLFKVRYRSFATAQQALDFLQSQDQNLPPLTIDDLAAVGIK